MAYWKIIDTLRQPRVKPSYLVKKTVNGDSSYSRELDASLHGVLNAISNKFLPGDIIETPEGFSFVHAPVVELNN